MARPVRTRSRPRARPPERTAEVVIEALGAGGDGLARLDGRPVHVPLTLPGDRVRIRVGEGRGGARRAAVERWIARMPRATPPCRHFGACGGCRLQHLDPASYRAWIVAQVDQALQRRGLSGVGVRPPLVTPPGSRRRMRFAFARSGGSLRLGLRAAGTHRIVDLAECPIARPSIAGLLEPLRGALGALAPDRPGEVVVTEALTGLDVVLIRPGAPALGERERLAALAGASDLARLSWASAAGEMAEPLAVRRPVRVAFGGIEVPLPPGAFLQATLEAEAAMRDAVAEASGAGAALADLFAGCGTFALPLAAGGRRVLAIDGDAAMIGALGSAAVGAGLGARVEARVRDLERDPLRPDELRGLDALVLDPPRAGALAQARALAEGAMAGTAPARVVMVSCHPPGFARDARILVDGGYRLDWVQPIDPFLWSAELEVVGAFRR